MKKFTWLEYGFTALLVTFMAICCPNVQRLAYALQVKINATPTMNILLVNASNTSQYLTGQNNTSVDVYYKNAGKGSLPMTGRNLVETDSSKMPGLYNLTPTANISNITGELIVYANSSASLPCVRTYDVVDNLESDSVALETATNSTVNHATYGNSVIQGLAAAVNSTVNHATYGNSIIQGLASATNATVNHATYGNSPTKTLLDLVNGNTTAINTTVNSATYGNNALRTSLGNGTVVAGSVTDKTGYVLNGTQAYNVTGNVLGNVTAVTNNVTVTNADVATSTRAAAATALSNATWTDTKAGYIDASVASRGTSNLTASDNIGINWADVSNPTTAVNLTQTEIKPGASGATAAQVWDYNISAVNTTGYAGTYLKGAASAGDPWSTDTSSGYLGQAGETLRRIDKNTKMR